MHTHAKKIYTGAQHHITVVILGKLADFVVVAALLPCNMVRQSCRVVHNTARLLHETQKFVVVERCNGCQG